MMVVVVLISIVSVIISASATKRSLDADDTELFHGGVRLRLSLGLDPDSTTPTPHHLVTPVIDISYICISCTHLTLRLTQ